ncbi:MAG: hypothetical protein R3F17_12200 [Planctomycetota bacterium]
MNRPSWKCLLPVLLALLHGLWFWGAGPLDDDFICYRYARNLLAGHGLVYNVGERFEGYTTPLWVFVHAAGQALGLASPWLAKALGLTAFVATTAWLARLAQREARTPWEALVLAAAPAMAFQSAAGLGTTCMALCLFGAWANWEHHPLRGGLWLALLCLLRQEFALFVLPLAWVQFRRNQLGPVWPALTALVGWTAFRLAYYGSWLPNTYGVKKLPVAVDLAYGAGYLLEATANFAWPLLVVLAAVAAWRSRNAVPRAFAAGLVLHSAYVVWVGGDFIVLSRFFVPTLPLALGLGALRVLPGPRALLPAVWMLGMQWNQVPQPFGDLRYREEARPVRLEVQRVFRHRWGRLGDWFAANVPPGSQVALSPIGAFGWHSDLPIVDILGLVNGSTQDCAPDLETHVKGHHRSDFHWVLAQEPAYVILGNGTRDENGRFTICPWEKEFYRSLQSGGVFPRRYRLASTDVGDGIPLDLFVRRDLPLPPASTWQAP